MSDENNNFYNGHRARLRQKFLEDKLADYELLDLLLGYAIPRRDVRSLARGLIQKFGGIYNVLTAPRASLVAYPGMGENTATFIKVIQSVMITGYKARLDNRPIYHDENLLADYCRLILNGKQIEEFHILYLDNDMRLIMDDLHSRGTSDWAAVYSREIVKRALELNAQNVLMVHNHPISGNSFSSVDIDMTTKLRDMLAVVNIRLYDHFLVSNGKIFSAKNMQLLK